MVRALVPVAASGGSFSGTLTGGANSFNAGQEFTYQFNVPAGEPSLNLGIRLADPDYGLEGFLIDPNGEPLDAQTTANDSLAPGPDDAVLPRLAGTWPVDPGAARRRCPSTARSLSEPFTGAISFTAPAVTASGIPNSASTVLPRGQPVTATIKVTNTGNISKDYFADPRLNGKVPQLLLGI